MERARASWTDERLDDLSRRVDRGFERLDADLRAASTRIDAQTARMDDGFRAVNGRIDDLQRLMVQLTGGTMATVLATLLSVILTRG